MPATYNGLYGKYSGKKDLGIRVPNDENHALEKEGKTDSNHDDGQDRFAYHFPEKDALS